VSPTAAHPGTSGAVTPLAQLAADDGATHVRIAAITTLGVIDEATALDAADRLANDADDDLAAAAIAAIGAINSRAAEDLLTRAAQSSRLPQQVAAIRAVAKRPAMHSIELLAWAARIGGPAGLQQDAIAGLCAIANAPLRPLVRRHAVETLLDLAADGSHRDAAISAIGTLNEDTVPDVASGLSASRVITRLAAVDGLAAMRNPRASRELARALRDEDPAVRSAAVTAFGKLGTPSVARTIAAMRRTDADPNVRHRAAQACERHGWQAGLVSRA